MIKFSNNIVNDEYLMIDIHIDGGILLASDILPIFASLELEKMYLNLFSFEKEIGNYIHEVSFRKNSALGQWLIANCEQQKIIYEENLKSCQQDKEYIVFENDKYTKRKLSDEKKLIIKISGY